MLFLYIIVSTVCIVSSRYTTPFNAAQSLLWAIANPESMRAASSSALSQSQRAYVESKIEECYRRDNESYALLSEKFKGRIVHCQIPAFPRCDVYLCGTLHVAKRSSEMVNETITALQPHYTVVELCDERRDAILIAAAGEEEEVLTLRGIVRTAMEDKSFLSFGTGLLAWMQQKASRVSDSRLGNELYVAAKVSYQVPSVVVLGDRLYPVTMQRCLERLNFVEKTKFVAMLLFEVFSMTARSIKDYIRKSEGDEDFLLQQMESFERHLPRFAEVIIHERDEYLAQTVYELARNGFRNYEYSASGVPFRGKIVVVVGAAHLRGSQKWLAQNGTTQQRMLEISRTNKDPRATWPGTGRYCDARVDEIFYDPRTQPPSRKRFI